VVRLDIATEGGGEREASFAALSLSAAEQIRQHIGDVGLVDEDEHTLYSASLRDRMLAGATTLQVGGAVAIGFLAWRYIRRLGPDESLEPGASPAFLGGMIGFVDDLFVDISASPALIALSIAGLLLAIWALSIVVSIVRWYGFRVIERGTELHQQRGVFSRSSTVIARDRIQAVEIYASPLRNLLGFTQISIVAAGAGGRERSRSRIFIPITAVDRASDYVRALWPETREAFDWQPVHPYYRRQYMNRGGFVLSLASLAAFNFVPLSAMTIVVITLALLVLAWLIWRTATPSFARTGFALSNGHLHVRRGAISPRRWIVAISCIQAVILEQSLPQRRHGIMNVRIDVNGLADNQRITIPNLPRAQAEKMQMELTPH
jgi:putative membrane protein